jgi:hypothetical protein
MNSGKELISLIELISSKRERFHFADRALRRANMRRFPYHLLFRERSDGLRVIVVRHDDEANPLRLTQGNPAGW